LLDVGVTVVEAVLETVTAGDALPVFEADGDLVTLDERELVGLAVPVIVFGGLALTDGEPDGERVVEREPVPVTVVVAETLAEPDADPVTVTAGEPEPVGDGVEDLDTDGEPEGEAEGELVADGSVDTDALGVIVGDLVGLTERELVGDGVEERVTVGVFVPDVVGVVVREIDGEPDDVFVDEIVTVPLGEFELVGEDGKIYHGRHRSAGTLRPAPLPAGSSRS